MAEGKKVRKLRAEIGLNPIPMVARATGRTIPDLIGREHVCEWQSSVRGVTINIEKWERLLAESTELRQAAEGLLAAQKRYKDIERKIAWEAREREGGQPA